MLTMAESTEPMEKMLFVKNSTNFPKTEKCHFLFMYELNKHDTS